MLTVPHLTGYQHGNPSQEIRANSNEILELSAGEEYFLFIQVTSQDSDISRLQLSDSIPAKLISVESQFEIPLQRGSSSATYSRDGTKGFSMGFFTIENDGRYKLRVGHIARQEIEGFSVSFAIGPKQRTGYFILGSILVFLVGLILRSLAMRNKALKAKWHSMEETVITSIWRKRGIHPF